ncbi:MAG: alpha/beta fold hydrolase BchO [Pseudomonadota bacterium]
MRHPPAGWPGLEHATRVSSGGVEWHFYRIGGGPKQVLLLHGTGSSSHSWYPVARKLARRWDVLVPDLPGQGFSVPSTTALINLNGMAKALGALLKTLDFRPTLIAGHSAGAAVACGLCLRGLQNPRNIASVNGALMPFGRAAAPIFSSAAQLLASSRMLPYIVAAHAITRQPIERMLRGTGSAVDARMTRCYRHLMGSPTHVTGTLHMMANWDLHQLERSLPRLEPKLHLLVGDRDEVVAPVQAYEIKERLPDAELLEFPDLGHLAHEERPELIAQELTRLLGTKLESATRV